MYITCTRCGLADDETVVECVERRATRKGRHSRWLECTTAMALRASVKHGCFTRGGVDTYVIRWTREMSGEWRGKTRYLSNFLFYFFALRVRVSWASEPGERGGDIIVVVVQDPGTPAARFSPVEVDTITHFIIYVPVKNYNVPL